MVPKASTRGGSPANASSTTSEEAPTTVINEERENSEATGGGGGGVEKSNGEVEEDRRTIRGVRVDRGEEDVSVAPVSPPGANGHPVDGGESKAAGQLSGGEVTGNSPALLSPAG